MEEVVSQHEGLLWAENDGNQERVESGHWAIRGQIRATGGQDQIGTGRHKPQPVASIGQTLVLTIDTVAPVGVIDGEQRETSSAEFTVDPFRERSAGAEARVPAAEGDEREREPLVGSEGAGVREY